MKQAILEIISLLFIVLFLYTGLSKLIDYSVFKEQIAASPLFEGIASQIAWLLPAMEIIVSVILFLPKFRLAGLYSTLVLMLLFTGYIIYILTIDEKLPCSCGGIIEQLSWKGHLIFNSVLIILVAIALFISRKKSDITPHLKTDIALSKF